MTRSLEEIVEQQSLRWEQARRSVGAEAHRPCVVFSRLPGAGAEELGRRLADRLGYAFFGIELVDRIAQQAGLRADLVRGVDEHIRSSIGRMVTEAFRHERFNESDYLRHLVHVVASLGERGAAVIVGRGSPFILPAELALRVLVVAPREARLERIAKREVLSGAGAERRLADLDAERREFNLHHFRCDPDDPTRFDVCVNTGLLSVDAAADVVVAALRGRFGSGMGA
jgi:cytidylate kinase